MTIKERILSVYHNQIPDQLPVGIYKRYLPSGELERKYRNAGMGILDFVPVVSLLAPPWHIQSGYVSEVKNVSFQVQMTWDEGEMIQVRKFETPVGSVTAYIVKDPGYSSDWIKKHYIESQEDYKVIQYIIENTVFKFQEKQIQQSINWMGEDGVVLGRVDRLPYQKLVTELAKPDQFLIDLYTQPILVEELLQVMGEKMDEQMQLAMDSKVNAIWSPDNITSDMTPPDMFRKYCFPFYQKYSKMCRDTGKIYMVHMDGKLNAIKDLIAQSPFDVIDSFSFSEVGGDVTVSEANKIWKDKVLCPNFPASICEQSQNKIEAYIIQKMDEFGNRPYMFQISEDIPIHSYDRVLQVLTSLFKK